MSDTPETDAFMTRIRGIDGDKHWVPADTAKRLERERASAIKKIQRQAERIRQLEGATNHAEGTPLSIALRERNEARAVADELASVAAHCLGWHEHESTDAAIKIAAALKRWKKSK
jgi:hypothetical protein